MKQRLVYPSVNLFGLEFFQGSVNSCHQFLCQQMAMGGLTTVGTPNPEQIILSTKNKLFQKDLLLFDVLIPDGSGIVFASKFIKNERLMRIAGVDLVMQFLLGFSIRQKVLIVGGRELEKYSVAHPSDLDQVLELTNLSAGKIFWTTGFQQFQAEKIRQVDEINVKKVIQTIRPDVIFVALGAPFQEEWIISNHHFLEENNVKLAMVVGGAFDMILGKVRRASQILRYLQLEWLFRLTQETWRWRRQLALIEFIFLTLSTKWQSQKHGA